MLDLCFVQDAFREVGEVEGGEKEGEETDGPSDSHSARAAAAAARRKEEAAEFLRFFAGRLGRPLL